MSIMHQLKCIILTQFHEGFSPRLCFKKNWRELSALNSLKSKSLRYQGPSGSARASALFSNGCRCAEMFYTSQYSPGGRERGQNCAWSPPSDPLVTYSSLQVTDTGKHQCYRLTDLMQVVGGGAKIVLWILAELLYEFLGRGFTAKTFAGLACIRPFFSSCILQSYSELETNNLHPT